MAKKKLYKLTAVWASEAEPVIDSLRDGWLGCNATTMSVLMQARQCYDNMDKFRRNRERNKNYNYGKQWNDIVSVQEGCRKVSMTEEDYIYSQGSIPLKQNLVRRLVKNVLGVYRSQSKEPVCIARDRDEQTLGETMSTALQYNWQLNKMNEVNARSFEEFLISGAVVHRKTYGWRNDRLDCWTDMVNLNDFFIDNGMQDVRGWDCSLIGQLHELSFNEVCNKFAKNASDVKELREIYRNALNETRLNNNCERFGYASLSKKDFFTPRDNSMCRVIEVWKKEVKARYHIIDPQNGDCYKINEEDFDELVTQVNEERRLMGAEAGMTEDEIPYLRYEWFVDSYWYYRYMTPFGQVLDEGETPYDHQSHPYVFRFYPYIDGEIHSFVEDVIDQQRYVNRLITMYDMIMRSSAKGTLMIHEDAIPEGMDISDIAEEYSRVGSVIVYRGKAGVPMPQQISSNSTNIGINELLQLQLKFFEDISGVNGALQGKQGYSSTSGTLYAQQTQNATTSLLDLLDTFASFECDAAYKDVKNMQQYYDQKRIINIVGKNGVVLYDPIKVRDVDFDLSVVEATNTPVYREMANQFIKEIWAAGQISLEQMLEHVHFPFADELLQQIKAQKEQMEQGQMPQGVSPDVMQQVQAGADQQAVAQAAEALQA